MALEIKKSNIIDIDEMIEIIPKMRLNVIKEIFESLGINLGKTNNEINYQNYMINDLDKICLFNNQGDNSSDIDEYMNNVTFKPITTAQQKINAAIAVKYFMNNLGLTKEQACGVIGPMLSESGLNPNSFNKGEKNGTYKSSGANNEGAPYGQNKCPWSYGAGICQWTFCNRKENAIMGGLGVSRNDAIKIIKGGGIESLTFEQQLAMCAYEFRSTYSNVLIAIKKCSTAAQAAATYYCHCLAGYKNTTEIATLEEVEKQNKRYSTVGAVSQISKGMKYGEDLAKSLT